jgi:hypothetical protein
METWTPTQGINTDKAKYIGEIEFQREDGEFEHFVIVRSPDKSRICFGGSCNTGFLESGYIVQEDYETLDEALQEMVADLECFYNDGAAYTSRIVCNDRM